MTVCIIGGGLMGMALARRVAMEGRRVVVIEREEQLGGLATWQRFDSFYWDRFYHVILPSDRHLIGLIRDLELAPELQWRRTRTGYYVDGQMHSVSNTAEFLRFPHLSLPAKFRLAASILYASRISDWKSLERITVEDWLIRVSGKSTYEKFWKPLLLAKLGKSYQRVSAVFIWSYIQRLFSARDKSVGAEQLGHVSGGYRMIFAALTDKITQLDGEIRTGTSVHSVTPMSDGQLLVTTDDGQAAYEDVVCTSPVPVLRRIVADGLLDVRADGDDIGYLGVICVVVISKTPALPYYVVNIAEPTIPFTGAIGMSTVVDTTNTGGYYLTYLPRYLLSTEAEFEESDSSISDRFLEGLRVLVPDFDLDEIVSVHVHRAPVVQPLQELEYSSKVPDVRSKHPAFFVLNTSQFVNATLNNNEVVRAVNEFYENEFRPRQRCA